MLFGKNPKRFFVSCDFRIGRFRNDESDLITQDVVEGNILQMVNRIIELLRSKYLLSPIHYEGITRIEQLEIPEDVLREAICNAILCKHLHKSDYVNNYIMSPSATFLQNVV